MTNTEVLSELSTLAEQINSSSDAVNAAIVKLNEQLRAMNLGIEAWIQIGHSGLKQDSRPARKYREVILLGFCKFDDTWQLAINEKVIDYVPNPEYPEDEDEITEDFYTALLKASRELRITAVEHFDDLLDALKSKATKTLASVTKAKKLAAPSKKGGK